MTTATLTRFQSSHLQVIALAAQGVPNREIAERTGLTFATVGDRLAAACRASGAASRSQLVAMACAWGQLQDLPVQNPGPVVLPGKLVAVLQGAAQGLSNQQIARRLGVSGHVVKGRTSALFRLLGARDRAHAVLIAWQLRVLPEVAGVGRVDQACPVQRRPVASERPAAPRWARGATPGSAGRYGAPEGVGVVSAP